jgi:hypothetical protein
MDILDYYDREDHVVIAAARAESNKVAMETLAQENRDLRHALTLANDELAALQLKFESSQLALKHALEHR